MLVDVCDVLAWFFLVCVELRAIVLIEGTSQNYEAQDDILLQTLKMPFHMQLLAPGHTNDIHMFPSVNLFAKLARASTRCFFQPGPKSRRPPSSQLLMEWAFCTFPGGVSRFL